MLKAVIFDLNGVIVDDEEYNLASWRQLFAEHKKQSPPDDQLTGRRMHDIIREVFGDVPDDVYERIVADKRRLYWALYPRPIVPVAGFMPFFDSLKKNGLKIGLATSSSPPTVAAIIDPLLIREQFDAIVMSSDVSVGKPDPQIYRLASERLGVAPERCVVFEDAPAGIAAAKAAGMACVALTTSCPSSELRGADRVIADFTEIMVEDLKELVA